MHSLCGPVWSGTRLASSRPRSSLSGSFSLPASSTGRGASRRRLFQRLASTKTFPGISTSARWTSRRRDFAMISSYFSTFPEKEVRFPPIAHGAPCAAVDHLPSRVSNQTGLARSAKGAKAARVPLAASRLSARSGRRRLRPTICIPGDDRARVPTLEIGKRKPFQQRLRNSLRDRFPIRRSFLKPKPPLCVTVPIASI